MRATDYLDLVGPILNSQKEITLGGSIARQLVNNDLTDCRDIDFFHSNDYMKKLFHKKITNLRNFRIESLGGRGYNTEFSLNNFSFTLKYSEWYLLHDDNLTYIINYMKLSTIDSVEYYPYKNYKIPVQFGSKCLGTRKMWDEFLNKPKTMI